MKKLYIGIGLILFNLIFEGFNFYVCNNSIGLSNECTFFKTNYGIAYFLGYNIYSIIGITLITIYFLKKDKMVKPINLNKKIEKPKKKELNKKKKNVSLVKKKRHLPKIEIKYILIISVIINATYIAKYTIAMQQNKKYIKTINYLIDDNFVKAEKYINNNKLYSNINYKLLVKKINNQPIQRLNQYSKTGLVIDWDTKYTCKRFITDADICKKNSNKKNSYNRIDLSKYKKAENLGEIISEEEYEKRSKKIDLSNYKKAENVGEMILFEDQLPKFPNLMPKEINNKKVEKVNSTSAQLKETPSFIEETQKVRESFKNYSKKSSKKIEKILNNQN